ncbi:hypothetical protein [Tamaricihabitans halophyticus]|uniref:hypothetical protein n=1 Tax=Tamaricihabitans halophyticus TaxID=1262583 RepID=UPI00104DDED1|nr:hypothetical protein [Tamaricihabitans halophyticus]
MAGSDADDRADKLSLLLIVITVVSALVVVGVWLIGPGLLGLGNDAQTRTVTATVTEPAPCGSPDASETVELTLDGEQREAVYSACGHREGEERQVAVPIQPGPGQLEVFDASAEAGQGGLGRPVSLALLALSCVGGGLFANAMATKGARSRAKPNTA